MHPKNPGWKPGDYWAVCDVCGQDYRISEMKMRWDGYLVCKSDWEPRHELDFIRATPDREAPEGPVRPVGTETELIVCTLQGRQAIAGYGIAGCMIAGMNDYRPDF